MAAGDPRRQVPFLSTDPPQPILIQNETVKCRLLFPTRPPWAEAVLRPFQRWEPNLSLYRLHVDLACIRLCKQQRLLRLHFALGDRIRVATPVRLALEDRMQAAQESMLRGPPLLKWKWALPVLFPCFADNYFRQLSAHHQNKLIFFQALFPGGGVVIETVVPVVHAQSRL